MAEKKQDLAALNDISPEMRKRLRVMIERNYPNFVLIGSDPSEKGGCCPSNEVGHANQLVASGILESWRPCCSKDACPGTYYAFRGERVPDTSPTEFRTNEELRRMVIEQLSMKSGGTMRMVLRAALLLFVAVCVGLIAARNYKSGSGDAREAVGAVEGAAASIGEGYLVCVIKTAETCSACESMESYAVRMLAAHCSAEADSGRIRYASIPAAGPQNRAFREEHGILATSLVLMEVKGGAVTRQKVLKDAWQLLQKEDEFAGMLQKELDQFMGLRK